MPCFVCYPGSEVPGSGQLHDDGRCRAVHVLQQRHRDVGHRSSGWKDQGTLPDDGMIWKENAASLLLYSRKRHFNSSRLITQHLNNTLKCCSVCSGVEDPERSVSEEV